MPRCFQIRDELLFSGWSDWSLKMHDLRSSQQVWSLDQCHKGGVTALDLGKGLKHICTGGNDGTVRLWTLSTKTMVFNLHEHAGEVTRVQLVHDDTSLVTSSRDKSIFVWNVERQKRAHSFYHSFGSVNAFDFHEASNTLISTGQDRKLTLWDLRQPHPVNHPYKGQMLEHRSKPSIIRRMLRFEISGWKITNLWYSQ